MSQLPYFPADIRHHHHRTCDPGPDLRAGHALQNSGTTWKDTGKVGRDGVVEPGDAVGEDSGDGGGASRALA